MAQISWLKKFLKHFYIARSGVAYEIVLYTLTHSFSGTKIKQEMVEKFAAFLTICSSVETLKYVVLMMYTVLSEGDYTN